MKEFSKKTNLYIFTVLIIGGILLIWNLRQFDSSDLRSTLLLCILGSAALMHKVEGATERLHYNTSFLVYGFALVLLGSPATILIILVSHIVEWIRNRYTWYIQIFNITSYIISIEAAGLVYKFINPDGELFSLSFILSALLASLAFTGMNHLMIGLVVWLARGQNFKESGIFDFLPLMIDFTLLCMGSTAAILWTLSPFTIILVLIPLYLIYSTLRVPALERQSEKDSKTGLYNARYFSEMLESELKRANRFNRPLTVIMADLDLLRNINNTYGHLAGDQVLIGVADILQQNVREHDIVARFGGEEFSVLMPETTAQQAYQRMEEIRKIIERAEFTVPTSVQAIKATLSFGIAERKEADQSVNDLVHNADVALYSAKLSGRNQVIVFDQEELEWVQQLDGVDVPKPVETLAERIESQSQHTYSPNPIREQQFSRLDQVAAESVSVDLQAAPQPSSLANSQLPSPAAELQHPVKLTASAASLPSWLISAYVIGLALVASTLFIISLSYPIATNYYGILLFMLLTGITEWISVEIYARDTAVSTSLVPMLVGSMLFGPIGVFSLSLTFAVIAWLKNRGPLSRLIFNASNQVIALMMVYLFVEQLGVTFQDLNILAQLLIMTIGSLVVYLITTTFVAVAVHLNRGQSVKTIWQERFSWLWPYYLAMGIVSFALTQGYQNAGVTGVISIVIPLLLIRFAQEQYLQRTEALVKELRSKNQELEKNSEEIKVLNEELLNALADVIDLRDPYVLGHSRHVSRYCVMIGKKMGLMPRRLELLRKAGLLHDIGKLGVPEHILFKPSKLTPAEYATIQKHVTLGAEIIGKCHSLKEIVPIIRHHHERYDGKGYPEKLKSNQIPMEARIMAVADAVEAMASDRPYRKGMSEKEILAELEQNSGTQFDPHVVQAFIRAVEDGKEPAIINSAVILYDSLGIDLVLNLGGVVAR